jgi:hypothetical protein
MERNYSEKKIIHKKSSVENPQTLRKTIQKANISTIAHQNMLILDTSTPGSRECMNAFPQEA